MDEDSEFREMVMKKLESSGFMQKMRVSTCFLQAILSILSPLFSRLSFELISIIIYQICPFRLINQIRKTSPNLKTPLKLL